MTSGEGRVDFSRHAICATQESLAPGKAGECLAAIRAAVRAAYATIPPGRSVIRGIFDVGCFFQPNIEERLFRYRFIVAQTVHQGCAYGFLGGDNPVDLVGKSYFSLTVNDPALDIAILDSLFVPYRGTQAAMYTLRGNATQKAAVRASAVANETMRLIPLDLKRHPKVINIGAVGNIIAALEKRGCEVIATDLDTDLIGRTLHGVRIQSGDLNSDLLASCDAAVITGMTLANGSIDELLCTATTCRTNVVMFAQSGSSFAHFYLDRGASAVVAEPFPFYIFQGESSLLVFRP